MTSIDLNSRLNSKSTRRTVVTTGVKLAYATPLVAASFKLNANGSLAQVPEECRPGFTFVPILDDCCKCDCTVIDDILDVATGTCHNPGGTDVTDECLVCNGGVLDISQPV
jgi:hypothetical protein